MGMKISKRYYSHSFEPISTKLHNKYSGDGGIGPIKFLAICRLVKKNRGTLNLCLTQDHMELEIPKTTPLQFSSDFSQSSWQISW